MARIVRVVVPWIPHHVTQWAAAIAKIIGARKEKQ